MVAVEHRLGRDHVVLDLGSLLPRDAEHPVEVVAHDGRLGAHRAHAAELLQLRQRFFTCFLAKLGRADFGLQLGSLVTPFLTLAQLLLDRLELFVQIIFALRLLHLPLDAVADLLLDLQHTDLALHVLENALKPCGGAADFQQLLLLGDLNRQVPCNRVSQLCRIVDLIDRDQHLGRNLLVELDVALKLADNSARQRLGFFGFTGHFGQQFGACFEEFVVRLESSDAGSTAAFHQHLHSAVGQLEQLQNRGDGADLEQIAGGRILHRRVLLRHQQDLLILPHHGLQGTHRFVAPDKEGHDHVREDYDIA